MELDDACLEGSNNDPLMNNDPVFNLPTLDDTTCPFLLRENSVLTSTSTTNTFVGSTGDQSTGSNDHETSGLLGSLSVNAQTAELRSLIDRVFAIVERRPEDAWARAFLLDDSPQATIQMLTNQAALPHAVTAICNSSCLELDDSHLGALDHTDVGEYMFVPSFSTGTLSVGAVVSRSFPDITSGCDQLSAPAAFDCAHDGAVGRQHVYSVGRFVREETTGSFLVLNNVKSSPSSSESPRLQLIFHEHKSSTRRDRIALTCDTETFRRGHIYESVLRCCVQYESRFCPVCKASFKDNCSCKLELRPPTHPFDFEGACLAMESHTGDFKASAGKAKLIVVCNDQKTRGFSRDAEMDTFRYHRSSPLSSFSSPGTSKQYLTVPLVSRIRINGFACVSSGLHGDEVSRNHQKLSSLLQSFAVQLSLSSSSPSKLSLPSFPSGCQNKLNNPIDHPMASSNAVKHGANPLPAREVSNENVVDIDCSSNQSHQLLPFSSGELSHFLSFLDPSQIAQQDGTSCPVPVSSVVPDAARQFGSDLGMSSSSDDSLPLFQAAQSNASSNASTELDQRGTQPYAVHATKKNSDFDASDLVTARELRRKLKNRASAARSNARRKALNEEMKAKLKDARDRVAYLRERQTQLVDENAKIRKRLQLLGQLVA